MGSIGITEDKFASLKKKPIEGRLFINGEFVASKSGKTFDIINPSTEKLAASVSEAGVEDVDAAVAAAKAAYPAWVELGAAGRIEYLNKLADALERRLPDLAFLDAISMGKPAFNDWANAITPGFLRFFASLAWATQGDSSLNTPGMVNLTFRQPYGVCGAIVPWNLPVMMVINKLGPALATGNTLVLKSSEKAPLTPIVIAQCCEEIGLPKGVFNLLNGYGRPCGEALAKHMDIRCLSFTGSQAVGRAVKKAAADSNLKNVHLELGGKSPLIVFEDADIEKAVPAAAFSILVNSGQACIASSRIYVHASIADRFTEAMKGAMTQIGKSGDPLGEGSLRGPQVDKIQFERIMDFMKYAQENKLDVTLGGDREGTTGYYIQPTIISNPPDDSRVVKEEIFGPVVCINTFTDEAEAIRRANDSEFGLYASVFTRDISRGLRVAKQFESGAVGINCTSPTVSIDMPFGGYKGSGDGRELSKYAIEGWTELKSVFIAL